ncbi:hypothetical protein AAIB78_000198 [Morganella morganii]
MENIEDFTDERHKAWCIHCCSPIRDLQTNKDHIPTKGLLDSPLPPHTPQIEICKECNTSFSLDEEYFIILLSCINSGTTEPSAQKNPKIQRALIRNPSLMARLEASKQFRVDENGEKQIIWQPEIDRIHRIILKNARGHAFYEYGEPMLNAPTSVSAVPLIYMNQTQRNNFEKAGGPVTVWPEVGSRMMTRIMTGQDLDNGWINVQDNIYRYIVFQQSLLIVRSVIHNYLATEVIWE